MNGIVVVDKPPEWTSHDVVAKLRGALKIKRVGHGGTLDPMATGVLPIFVGRATRAAQFCENADKEYVAGLKLGIVTDTQDTTGKILTSLRCHSDSVGRAACPRQNQQSVGRAACLRQNPQSVGRAACPRRNAQQIKISEKELQNVLSNFLGAQKQLPPMYSAIKQDGKKLYELARKGIEVERPFRDILISEIELLGGKDDEFQIRVVCSKGTYIRTLCHDIGASLGCGGVMSSLRRTAAGVFKIENAVSLEQILSHISENEYEKFLLPTDSIFSDFPTLTLNEQDTKKCKNGVQCHNKNTGDGKYRVYAPDGEFLMFAEVIDETLKMIKGFYLS
jgi:tRNA pseudouridine55 synthase